ncbi:MAG: hypothetical protein U9Q82_02845, partial [Chloroflexota bacterium]|nr:hypothetical protein [Chloroflexota bacterium]
QETNWSAPIAYLPLIGEAVENQHLHFTYTKYNFGVIRADFSDPETPRVSFELHKYGRIPPIVLDTTV